MLASKEPRLTIKKLTLINFKSYAGVQQVGPFHKSFTSIVGPNGSGKSNVIDALLFVFGFRAKKMRQAKLSQLIHKSNEYPDLNSCTVEIHFEQIVDNAFDGTFEVVTDSQLVVSRTAYENNSSKYQINGANAAFSQVVTLLKSHGIDLGHNRFLILQGEVELIAQMKPKSTHEGEEGLLEYLEDIIGTAKYKQPIEEALKAVDELDEQRAGQLSRLKIVEKDYQSYRERAQAAEAAINTENLLVRTKNMLYQKLVRACDVNMQLLQEIVASLTENIAAVDSGNSSVHEQLAKNESLLKEAQREYDEIAQKQAELQQKMEELSHRDLEMQEQRKQIKSKTKLLSASLESNTKEKGEMANWITAVFPAEKAQLADAIAKLEGAERDAASRLDSLKKKLKESTKDLQAQLDKKKRELLPFSEREACLKARRLKAESKAAVLKKKSKEYKDAVYACKDESFALETELSSVAFSLSQKQAEETQIETALEEKDRQQRQVASDLQSRRKELEMLYADQASLEESRRQHGSRSKLLQALTEEHIAGRLNGFYGRLGDLGTINNTYDVAVTTACAQLNDIVVSSVEEGQRCIEFLRRSKLGRARFICLDKMAKPPPRNSFKLPHKSVSRLFDLIEPNDPKFAPAFYYALSDTLVAPNMQTAQLVAYGAQRYRVVTLDGKLIDKAGTMSGGGSQPLRGGMSSVALVNVAQTEKQQATIQKNIAAAEEAIMRLESQLQMLESQFAQRSKERQNLAVNIQKLTMDRDSAKARYNELQARMASFSEDSDGLNSDEKRVLNEAEGEVSVLNVEFAEFSEPLAVLKSQVAVIESKIIAQGGKELETASKQLSSAQADLRAAEQSLAKLEIAHETKARTLRELEETLPKLIEEAALAKESSKKLKEQMEAQLDVAMQIKLEMDSLGTDKAFSKVDELKKKGLELEKELEKEAEQLVDWKNQIKERNAELSSEAKRKMHWDKERFKLCLINCKEPLEEHSPDELDQMDKDELTGEIVVLEAQVDKARPDLAVLEEFQRKTQEYLDRAKEVDTVTKERDNARERYNQARKARMDAFMNGFTQISESLKEMYQMITMGGNAELELVDSLDPFSEGIVFSVMPPKKTWKNISNLSGGEKTLSSLALVFALHQYKPTPIYVMDEIDAALDFKNVSIVAAYIKERTQNAQFLIISLRNNMFELADRLVGIYKTKSCTKSITINPSSVAKNALLRIALAARLERASVISNEFGVPGSKKLMESFKDNCI